MKKVEIFATEYLPQTGKELVTFLFRWFFKNAFWGFVPLITYVFFASILDAPFNFVERARIAALVFALSLFGKQLTEEVVVTEGKRIAWDFWQSWASFLLVIGIGLSGLEVIRESGILNFNLVLYNALVLLVFLASLVIAPRTFFLKIFMAGESFEEEKRARSQEMNQMAKTQKEVNGKKL